MSKLVPQAQYSINLIESYLPMQHHNWGRYQFETVVDDAGQPIISNYGLPKAKINAFEVQPLPAF